MDKKNVSASKPRVAGAIFVSAIGTVMPTDASSVLTDTFNSLGYVSEDDVSNSNSPEKDNKKAWGGDNVLNLETAKEDTFSFTLIESLNIDVLKNVYGDENVKGTLETGIEIKANNNELIEKAYVIDMILKGGILKRIVIPCASISEIGEIVYKNDEAIGYEITLSADTDKDGQTHYEYILKPTKGDE